MLGRWLWAPDKEEAIKDPLIGFHDEVESLDARPRLREDALSDGQFLRDLANGGDGAARQLVQQIKDDREFGGSTGLLALSRAFRGRIVAFQLRILNGNREAATEAWNDTLVDVWERIEDYNPRLSKFRTWLYNTARYQALARKRRLIRDQRMPVVDLGPTAQGMPAAFEIPDPLTTGEKQALERAFRRLSPPQRQLLWFRFVEGWMPHEIVSQGLVSGVGPKSVRVYINRTSQRLKDYYDQELQQLEREA